MNNNLSATEVAELLDGLTWINHATIGKVRVKYHHPPILIGDILEKMGKKFHHICSTGNFDGTEDYPTSIKEEYDVSFKFRKILFLWANVDISESLQQIVKDGWECVSKSRLKSEGDIHYHDEEPKQLKPDAQELLSFIKSLDLK